MAPRPGDKEDEDWEDDFGDFPEKPTSAVISSEDDGAGNGPAMDEDFGDFGGFTQVAMTGDEVGGESIGDGKANVTAMATTTAGPKDFHQGSPMVETVGDYTEFSNSEAAGDFAAFQSTSTSAATTQPLDAGTSAKGVASDDAASKAEQPAAAESLMEDHFDEIKDTPLEEEKEEDIGIKVETEDTNGDFDDFGTSTPVEDLVTSEPESVEAEVTAATSEVDTPAVKTEDNGQTSGGYAATEMTNNDAPLDMETVDPSESFGDFDMAPVATATTSFNAIPPVETVDNSDSFGVYGSAELMDISPPKGETSNAATTTPTTIPETKEGTTDEIVFFGAFGSGTSNASGQEASTAADGKDMDPFGGLETAGTIEPAAASLAVDEFASGEFQTTPQLASVTKENLGEDDFGDFGAANPEMNTASGDGKMNPEIESHNAVAGADYAKATSVPNAISNDDDDDDIGDFGDFGTAKSESETQQPAPDDSLGLFEASEPVVINTETPDTKVSDDNGDDFGDFGTTKSAKKASTGDGTDFGDFGTAEDPVKSSPGDDDDFGDFNAAEAPQKADEDDDFGGFDAAEAPQKTEDDDDDFGDFGAAEAPEETDDDHDDFGNFGAAESIPQTATTSETKQASVGTDDDDDFGGFSDVGDGGTRAATSPVAPAASLGSSDPLLQPVATAMHQMFQKPSAQVPDGDSSDAPVEKLSMERLMVSPNLTYHLGLSFTISHF
mgnify:CR=1 FL=1